jgi:pimeloyl-ACP methyl ester carboxylesterase
VFGRGEPAFSAERELWRELYYMGERTLTTRDGITLTADYYAPEAPSDRWVLLLNCYQSRVMYVEDYCKALQERGFHVLAADMRGRGRSGGEFFGMAAADRQDILDWLRYIEKTDPSCAVLLYGFSGGGTAALAALPELPACVAGVITDSAFASGKDEAGVKLKAAGLPAFPFMLTGELAARVKAGYWLSAGGTKDALGASSLPLLLIYGAADSYAPPGQLEELLASIKHKDIAVSLLVPGAEHCQSANEDPGAYWKAIDDFINNRALPG